MAADQRLYNLTIYLIKLGLATSDQVIKVESCEPPVDVPVAGYGSGQLFIKRTPDVPPKWVALFAGYINPKKLEVPGISAAFLIQIDGRCFVLTFGQGGRFLLKDDVHEERFGLLCALNCVDPKTFRCIDVQSLDAIQSHTRIQSGQETTSDQFGLDVEQDMLKAIVGAPLNSALGNRMTGSDALSVSVKMNLSELPLLLEAYRSKFEVDLNAEHYEWVNNIAMIKSAALTTSLETMLDAKLAAGNFDHTWLAIPEIP